VGCIGQRGQIVAFAPAGHGFRTVIAKVHGTCTHLISARQCVQGCQSPGDGARRHGQSHSRSVSGRHRQIDIGRTPEQTGWKSCVAQREAWVPARSPAFYYGLFMEQEGGQAGFRASEAVHFRCPAPEVSFRKTQDGTIKGRQSRLELF